MNDPRRHWRSLTLTPTPLVERSGFHKTPALLTANIKGAGLVFLVDQQRVVHVAPGTALQLSGIAELPEAVVSPLTAGS
jgi:hypothetical protein